MEHQRFQNGNFRDSRYQNEHGIGMCKAAMHILAASVRVPDPKDHCFRGSLHRKRPVRENNRHGQRMLIGKVYKRLVTIGTHPTMANLFDTAYESL